MKKALLVLTAVGVALLYLFGCGTNTLSTVSGGRVQTSHVNQAVQALNQDIVPRNSSGVPTDLAGSFGSSSFRWLRSWFASGDWKAGDIKIHHSFNGAVKCGQGWMLADGDIINEANYDADTAAGHTAGDWDIYVISSPLDGKYSPNMTGSRYPSGVAATTQDGTIAITAVGNASNQINIAHDHTHTHTGGLHGHEWYGYTAGVADSTWDSSGNAIFIGAATSGEAFSHLDLSANAAAGGVTGPGARYYTAHGGNVSTGNNTSASSLSSTQSIQPISIEVQYCIRVID